MLAPDEASFFEPPSLLSRNRRSRAVSLCLSWLRPSRITRGSVLVLCLFTSFFYLLSLKSLHFNTKDDLNHPWVIDSSPSKHGPNRTATSFSPHTKETPAPQHTADYGGLIYYPTSSRRHIQPNDSDLYEQEQADKLRQMEEDTDSEDEAWQHYDELDYSNYTNHPQEACYRPKWSFQTFPSCNKFHELTIHRPHDSSLQQIEVKFLGQGHYRQTWLLASNNGVLGTKDAVLKSLRVNKNRNFNAKAFATTQMEALVMNEFTSSPFVITSYGLCGTSLLVERGYPIEKAILPIRRPRFADDETLSQLATNFTTRNQLTAEQKLAIALAMAQGIAELHGYSKGVIINDDLKSEQWLLDQNGNLKLADFNRAHFMHWNPHNQTYCRFQSSLTSPYRSPEALRYEPCDESSEVYALGMVLLSVLVGWFPFYEKGGFRHAIEANMRGERPYLDPQLKNRTFIEGRIVEIIEQCWAKERVSVFTVVQHLRETVKLYEEQPFVHQKIKDVSLLEIVNTTTNG